MRAAAALSLTEGDYEAASENIPRQLHQAQLHARGGAGIVVSVDAKITAQFPGVVCVQHAAAARR